MIGVSFSDTGNSEKKGHRSSPNNNLHLPITGKDTLQLIIHRNTVLWELSPLN